VIEGIVAVSPMFALLPRNASHLYVPYLQALSRFRHPNIAALFAYTDPIAEGHAAGYHLVYELAEKGSLDKYLEDDLGRCRLGSFQRRVQVAIDVMTALQFLHKGNDQIKTCFHRDVKSANVVLKRDFTAQLIDCGLAQFVNDDIKTTGIKGTKGYICLQYVRTGKYLPACDIYSFGVVMLELWTGRIQNQKDESGAEFNFGEEYIHEDRDVSEDADPAMDLGCPLPEFSTMFADLALQCISERSKHRPSGDEVLKSLKAILDECFLSSDHMRVGGTLVGDVPSSTSSGGPVMCSTCRTFNSVPHHSICALCLCREDIRKGFANMVSSSINQSPGGLSVDALSDKIVLDLGQKLDPKLDDIIRRIDAALPVLAHLDRRLNNQVPRTFLLVPADVKRGWQHPRSWLRSNLQKKYYLFFVCPASQQVVSPPIKLKVANDWFRKAAPVLASGLFLLKVGLKAGLNVSLDLDGTGELFHVSSDQMLQVLEELSVILKECGDDGLMDRLRSGCGSSPALLDKDVRELCGDAYELVVEKAVEQNGWRSAMEPVRLPPSPKVFWVTKLVAQEPQYEIVKA
jgi:serine/threonine protein kinase